MAYHPKRPGADIPPQPEDPLKLYRTLLGLPAGFTQAQLKAACRATAAQYHPDRYESAPAKGRGNDEKDRG
jgi:curved DNA-binding protein CbpA